VLTTEQAIDYWDRRHQREGLLRSGGDIGLSPEANEIFYASRLGKLLDLVGLGTSDVAPRFMLDAGCGKGWFSEAMQRCGQHVTGVDASAAAVEHCRRMGTADYVQSTLDAFTSPWLYDVVYSVDVLFHLVDDHMWRRSLLNLASLVRLSGKLIVTDVPGTSTEVKGDYIVHRPHATYVSALTPAGFKLTRLVPYNFGDNAIAFACYVRTA
jgi:2-polyprenyl-3-methyl-5-hydroxy-6-metoxy-1,4-benzoquinol methylase